MKKPKNARGHGVRWNEIKKFSIPDPNGDTYLRFLLRAACEKLKALRSMNKDNKKIVDREEWLDD